MTADVRATVEEYAARWVLLDAAQLIELWEPGDQSIYVAEEIDDILVGREAIHEHLARTHGRLLSASLDLPKFWHRQISEDVALAVFVVAWRLTRTENAGENLSHSRVSAVLKRIDGEWRFASYMEEPYFLPTHSDDWSQFVNTINLGHGSGAVRQDPRAWCCPHPH